MYKSVEIGKYFFSLMLFNKEYERLFFAKAGTFERKDNDYTSRSLFTVRVSYPEKGKFLPKVKVKGPRFVSVKAHA
jgi:hypothetical protein